MTVEKVTEKSIMDNTGICEKNPNTSSRPKGSDSQYILYLFQRENPLHIPETCAGGSFFSAGYGSQDSQKALDTSDVGEKLLTLFSNHQIFIPTGVGIAAILSDEPCGEKVRVQFGDKYDHLLTVSKGGFQKSKGVFQLFGGRSALFFH